MDVESNEYANETVPEHRTTGWLRIGLVSAMVSFSLPTFLTGAEVFLAVENTDGFLAVLAGCGLLTVIAALCGVIGARCRLSSYMLTRIAFGSRGAMLVNLAFALSLLGWFGVNIDLFSDAVVRLLEDTLGLSVAIWPVELAAGVVMTVTTAIGFRIIQSLSALLIPVMMTVTAVLLYTSLGLRSLSDTLAVPQTADVSLGYAISSIVGGVIVGAVIMPDITRFIREWRGAIYTALLSYLLVQSIVMVSGGLAADVLSNGDLLDVLLLMGLSWAAFAIVIAGSWVLNSLNLYSTALSVEATFSGLPGTLTTIVLGVLGTAAAFLNILDYFLTFLFYLSVIFVPVAGVLAVDHFLLRPKAYVAGADQAALRPTALLAWASGSVIALLGSEGLLQISGIAALDAMVAAAVVYFVLGRWVVR